MGTTSFKAFCGDSKMTSNGIQTLKHVLVACLSSLSSILHVQQMPDQNEFRCFMASNSPSGQRKQVRIALANIGFDKNQKADSRWHWQEVFKKFRATETGMTAKELSESMESLEWAKMEWAHAAS